MNESPPELNSVTSLEISIQVLQKLILQYQTDQPNYMEVLVFLNGGFSLSSNVGSWEVSRDSCHTQVNACVKNEMRCKLTPKYFSVVDMRIPSTLHNQ